MLQNIGLFNISKGSGVYHNAERYGLKIIDEQNNADLFQNYKIVWPKHYLKERQKIEKWLFNNRKQWKKLCYGWNEKYKMFFQE